MNRKNFPLLCSAGLLIVLLLSACGTNTGAGCSGAYGGGCSSGASQAATAPVISSANVTATAAAVATNNAYSSGGYGGCGRYCSGSPTPTTGTTGSAVAIKTATITVAGKSETVLTNAQGLTLYYRTSDTPSSVCSGGCASAWPPFIASSTPSASTSLPGKLGLLNDANGSQVTYNGHPLYTYSGDSSPGQSNGQGVAGVWFVVTTGLAA